MTATPLEDLAATVEDGDILAFGGKTIHRAPMAFVRAVARRPVENLTVIGLAKSLDVDLLCATNQLSTIYYGYVGFEWMGLAHNFRRAIENGNATPNEGSCYTVATMFRAAAQGVPFLPIAGMDGSELPDAIDDRLQTITCPYTEQEFLAVRAIAPDVAVIHANVADRDGNALLIGGDLTEMLIAKAASSVYVTAEQVVDHIDFIDQGSATHLSHAVHIPHLLVDAVAEVPYGAHPTSCPGAYEYDRAAIKRYIDISRTSEITAHIDQMIGDDEATYRRSVVEPNRAEIRWDVETAGGRDERTGEHDPCPDESITVAELLCVSLARRLLAGEYRTAFQGFASPLPTIAIRLARAQDSSIIHLSASGAVNAAPPVMPTSTEDQHLFEGASGAFTSPDCFDLAARGDLDVMFVGSPQFDRYGRLNGSVVGDWDDPTVKFPGSGGTASLLPLIQTGIGWRTEHSTRTLPESVDFVTASGNLAALVTPLCQFEMIDDELQVTQLHPGVTREMVQNRTGWPVRFETTDQTPLPTDEELDLLDQVDPSRIRRSEFSPDQLTPIGVSDGILLDDYR